MIARTNLVILKVEIDSAFVAIPGIMEFTPPETSPITSDQTELQHTSTRKRAIGRSEVTDGKLVIKFDPQDAVHADLISANDYSNTTFDQTQHERNFEVHYPTGTGCVESWPAVVRFKPSDLDKKQVAKKEITLEVCGAFLRDID